VRLPVTRSRNGWPMRPYLLCLLITGLGVSAPTPLVTARTVQGMARDRSGKARPRPYPLAGGGAEAPTLKGWVPKMLSAKRS